MDLLMLGSWFCFLGSEALILGGENVNLRRGLERQGSKLNLLCEIFFLGGGACVVYVRHLAPGSSTRHERVVSLNAPVAQGALTYVYLFFLQVRQFYSR